MSFPRLFCCRLVLSRSLHSSKMLTNFTQRTVLPHTAYPTLMPIIQHGHYCTTASHEKNAPTTGFSNPGARRLSEVVKLQLLNKHGAGKVREIWNEYHKDHKSAVGDVLTAEEYGLLRQRSERCRHFVLPVHR